MSRWLALVLPTMLTVSTIGCASHLVCDNGCSTLPLEGACTSCGEVGCDNHHPTPSNALQHISSLGDIVIRGGGCGDVYYDEWINEPPECDECNFGGANHPIHPFGGWRTLWGHREQSGDIFGACSSCAGSHNITEEIPSGPVELLPEETLESETTESIETPDPQTLPGPDARNQRSIIQPRTARSSAARWEPKTPVQRR